MFQTRSQSVAIALPLKDKQLFEHTASVSLESGERLAPISSVPGITLVSVIIILIIDLLIGIL